MKTKILLRILCFFACNIYLHAEVIDYIDNYNQICRDKIQYFKKMPIQKGTGVKTFKRWKNFWDERLFPNDLFPDLSKITAEALHFITGDMSTFQYKSWKEYGPFIVPANRLAYPSSGLGRVSCIAVNPLNNKHIIIGSASGGLWTSYNGGISWTCIQSSQIMSVGISDIKYSADTNVIYAATGDIDGATMSRNYSVGIIRSIDGGKTWNIAGDTSYYSENLLISSILTFHKNKLSACAGTNRGLIFTEDGFNSVSRTALEGCYVRSVTSQPENPHLLIATIADTGNSFSIVKSIDDGATWNKVLNLPNASRIAISFSKLCNNEIFAVASRKDNNGFAGFYASFDAGSSWIMQSDSPNILAADAVGKLVGGQGNYDLCIETSPEDSSTVFIGGVNLWKSVNSGLTWLPVTHWSGDADLPFVHADHHSLCFLNDSTFFSCNDGGIYISRNAGVNWNDVSNGLSISQIYRLNIYPLNSKLMIVGTQDNGTLLADDINWEHIFGGDGMGCLYAPDDQFEMFFSINNGSIYRSLNAGSKPELLLSEDATNEKSQWVSVISMNPQNHNTIYTGFENIWVSDNYGNTSSWNKISDFNDSITINTMVINPRDTNNILVAKSNKIYETHNYGNSWNLSFTSPTAVTSLIIDSVGSIYITCSGYNDTSKVFCRIAGKWENISTGLPNVPVNTAVCDYQNSTSVIYIGTDIGCFWFNPFRKEWEKYGSVLPCIVINDMDFHPQTRTLAAGTFGRGLWKCNAVSIVHKHLFDYPERDYTMCAGDTLSLTVQSDYPVFWSDNTTDKKINITSSGSYYAYSLTQNGDIEVSDTVNINIIPKLTNIYTDKPNYCVGDVAYLSADSSMTSVVWNTGDSLTSINTEIAGDYFFDAVTSEGCKVHSDTLALQFHPLPQKPAITRIGNTLFTDYTDTTKFKLSWFLDDSLISCNMPILNISLIGNYYLLVEDLYGCTVYSDTLEVTSTVGDEANQIEYDNKVYLRRNEQFSLYKENPKSRISVYDISGDLIDNYVFFESTGKISFNNIGTFILLRHFGHKFLATIFLVN